MTIEAIQEHIIKIIHSDAYKVIFIKTLEEFKVIRLIKSVAEKENMNLYLFDVAEGLRCEADKRINLIPPEKLSDPSFALRWLESNAVGIVAILSPEALFSHYPFALRLLKNIIIRLEEASKPLYFVLISTSSNIPPELQTETAYIEAPLPTREEIEAMVSEAERIVGARLNEELRERLINTLQGLKETEILKALRFSVSDGTLSEEDINTIIELKKSVIRKDSLLEFYDLRVAPQELGGLKNLKEWISRKKYIFEHLEKAQKFGVSVPKGILLFGMPGCGKSLAAKVIASEFKLPLLRLDMGLILGPYVGQSEENIRHAIRLAEAVAPSVLWIDELEKVFSGISGDSGSSDVMRRVFATFLTWMQEKTQPVFVIATANDISQIPLEFLRKGRFDEIFYVDFPNDEEIKEILQIHLKKRGKEEHYPVFEKFLPQLKGFSGAEIEALVVEVVERMFIKSEVLKQSFDLESEIQSVLSEFKPISKSMPKKVEEIKNKLKEISAKTAN